MDSPMLSARSPFDLIVANILAGPLAEMAADFARSLSAGGTVILAGLLDHQADEVTGAYQSQGLRVAGRCSGEWPVLVIRS
jgi:ribosomal protein L11 methyltransferase